LTGSQNVLQPNWCYTYLGTGTQVSWNCHCHNYC